MRGGMDDRGRGGDEETADLAEEVAAEELVEAVVLRPVVWVTPADCKSVFCVHH